MNNYILIYTYTFKVDIEHDNKHMLYTKMNTFNERIYYRICLEKS